MCIYVRGERLNETQPQLAKSRRRKPKIQNGLASKGER